MIRRFSLLLFCIVVACGMGAAATDDNSRIARLSYLDGHVSFQHANDTDWAAASINLPMQPGDRIYTGDDGRAEIEFDDGSVYHLAEKTDVEILSLMDDVIQIRVLLGLSTLTVNSGVNFEVDTPAAAFNTLRKGVYRFDVVEDGNTDAIVRKGILSAANGQFSRQVDQGELLHAVPGDAASALSAYKERDQWDEWTDRRSADLTAHTSRQYIPSDVAMGVSELDTYGHWVNVDTFGPAWVPFGVDPFWSPYWVGRWCYRPYWGWTWVSYEPWGWLPYHYGRWYYSAASGWCWVPGPSFGFNFWSPGLVRFYSGPGWLSWCPLGPHDYYNVNNYFFRRSYAYQLNNLRALQTRGPVDLVNRTAPGAFRTVPNNLFVSSSFGSRGEQVGGVTDPWKSGRIVTGRLDIRPVGQSFAPAPGRPVERPVGERSLPVVVRTQPTARTIPEDRMIRLQGGNPRAPESGRSQTVPNRGTPERNAQPNTGVTGRTYPTPRPPSTTNDSRSGAPRPEANPPRRMETPPAQPRPERPAPPAGDRESRPKPRSSGPSALNSYGSGSGAETSAPRVQIPRFYQAPNPQNGGGYTTPSSPRGNLYSPPTRTFPAPQAAQPGGSFGGGFGGSASRAPSGGGAHGRR